MHQVEDQNHRANPNNLNFATILFQLINNNSHNTITSSTIEIIIQTRVRVAHTQFQLS